MAVNSCGKAFQAKRNGALTSQYECGRVPDGLDRVRDIQQLARGILGIGIGAGVSETEVCAELELPGSLAALSPFRPHVWAALRDQSMVRVASCLDPNRALWRTLSHHNPANDA
jgi:hypothetical protein